MNIMTRNRFWEKSWQATHLEKIKQQAGKRYTPELNVEVPIGEIFDGISRTKKFYTEIRSHYGKLNRHFRRVSPKYTNAELQTAYNALSREMSKLTELLGNLKEYNTKEIPWGAVHRLAKRAKTIAWAFSKKLKVAKTKAESAKAAGKKESHLSVSERINSDTHTLYETQKELSHFEALSSSVKAKLSNNPFLLLTGKAGTGKTHLLCDIVGTRFATSEPLPAVLVFGEHFGSTEDPFKQIISQLDLSLNRQQFLHAVNNAGKKTACRALIVIDALNETRQRSFWIRNLAKLANEVKKYPNIALVISIRSGFAEEVLTKKQKKRFVHEEHRGFQFREWEAVNKFFQEFQIPLPEIPLLMPEFQNPLFLLLFCEAFKARARQNKGKNPKQIFRGHEGATYIFETFVKAIADRIASDFKLPKGRNQRGEYVIWDTVIEKIAAEMVHQGSDSISEDQVARIIRTAYPSIDCYRFIKELDSNSLLVKVPRPSMEQRRHVRFEYRFPFQKFSDHLIGRYIFTKYEKEFGKQNKNLETAKRFFLEQSALGKFLSVPWTRGIIEALSIQCPEYLQGCELVDVAPYLRDSPVAQDAFVESLIWRKPTAFSADRKNTLTYINSAIVRTKHGRDALFNALLAVAPIPNHPFNSDRLHQHLSKFSMAKRDAWWSTFLHDQHGARDSVDRLIEWGWSEHVKTHITDDAVRLCAVALSWFLTTPNRSLRDKATKALVVLLNGKLNVVLALLKQFKGVNDPYVAERLYAVAYGCALRSSKNRVELRALSEWVYNEIFKHGNPPPHILLRDYARGIIEVALKQYLCLRIPKKKIRPPYNGKRLYRFPSIKTIKAYQYDHKSKGFKDHFWAQNVILNSMQPEHSEISSMYGDFGRYTFQMALSHFSYPKKVTMQKLSNWAIKRVFNLGYDVKLHGPFDRKISVSVAGRSRHPTERIGKKYQWIALYELLARVSDNFELKEESWSRRIGKYAGPWQLGIRDIDPSCILKEFPNKRPAVIPDFSQNEIQGQYNAWSKNLSDAEWLKKSNDLPDPRKVIEFIDGQGSAWVALEGVVEWQEETPPEREIFNFPARTLWYMIKSYLIRNSDHDKAFNWARQQRFTGRWMPESHSFSDAYLAEYPWYPAFLYHYIHCYHHDGWTDKSDDLIDKELPAKFLATDDEYSSPGASIDRSTNEGFRVKLPAKLIADKMNLIQVYADGRFFDKRGDLVAFDPSVFDEDMPKHVLIRKDKLSDFLKRNGYALFWTLLGEKNVIDGGMGNSPGRLEIDGAYTLVGYGKIIGKKRSHFVDFLGPMKGVK